MEPLKMSTGTLPETGQAPGTLAKVKRGGKTEDVGNFEWDSLHEEWSHWWERELPFRGRVTAVQGVVDHRTPAAGCKMGAVGM